MVASYVRPILFPHVNLIIKFAKTLEFVFAWVVKNIKRSDVLKI